MALIICPECRRKFSTHAASCPRCGFPLSAIAELENIQATERVNNEQRRNKNMKTALTISLISVSAIIILIISYVVLLYSQAVVAKNNQEFTKAKECYDRLLIADRVFPDDYAYVTAGVLMERNADIQAMNAFNELDNYNIPHSIIETLQEDIYSSGQWYYHRQNYKLARQYFEAIDEYRRSEDYLLLLKCHIEGADDLGYSDFTRLISLLDFEDTESILITTSKIASRFLEGRWENNGVYFQMNRSPSSMSAQFNLPHEGIQECASIEYGDYCTYAPMGEDVSYLEYHKSRKKHFEIQIVDKDTIRIYCYKDNSVYILYRQ